MEQEKIKGIKLKDTHKLGNGHWGSNPETLPILSDITMDH
jgi:hypothetical protein